MTKTIDPLNIDYALELATAALDADDQMRICSVEDQKKYQHSFNYLAKRSILSLVHIVKHLTGERTNKRQPGSARGQIQILDDFDTPDLAPDFNVPIKIEPDQPGGSISFVVKDKTGQVVSIMTLTNVSIEQIGKK